MRKLLSTQVWFWLLIGALALSALGVVGQVLGDGSANNPGPRLITPEGQRNLFAQSAAAGVFVVILAIIGITAEYRYLTATPTYLVTPRRNLVVTAKLITYALVGLVYSVLCALLVIAMAKPWLAAKHIPVSLTYAIWSGVGTALIAVGGVIAFGETMNAMKLASLGVIVLGVAGLSAAGGAH